MRARLRRRLPWLVGGLVALAALTVVRMVWMGDAATAVVRTVPLGQFPSVSAMAAPQGRFFIANTNDDTVSVLDTRSGRLLRTIAVGGQLARRITSTVTDARGGHVFVATDDNRLTMLDAHSGAMVRTLSLIPCLAGLAVDERTARLFAADCQDGKVRVIDTHSGRQVATIRLRGSPAELSVDEQSGRVFVGEAGQGPIVSVLDAASGRVIRSFRLGTLPCLCANSPAPNGPVFVDDYKSARIYVLDPVNGRLLRTVPIGMDIYGIATDPRTDRVFLVGAPPQVGATFARFTGAGRLVVLDGRSGRVIRRLALAAPPAAVAVDPRGRLLVGQVGPTDVLGQPTGMGQVVVLDARSLRSLGSIQVGIDPWSITVDPTTQRAFVVNANVAQHGWDPSAANVTHLRLREGWWHATERGAKSLMGWLPLDPGPAPVAPTNGSVTVIDLARL